MSLHELNGCCCRYNTYIAHYKELECMRTALEPLLYHYGVDIIFTGYGTG